MSLVFLLAAASGLRIGELVALRADDMGKNTIRVDESLDGAGVIGPCKNVAAYRAVVLVYCRLNWSKFLCARVKDVRKDFGNFTQLGIKSTKESTLRANHRTSKSRIAPW